MRVWEMPGNRGWFVYHLLDQGQVVYVGQSYSLYRRLQFHVADKSFDAVRVFEVADEREMTSVEQRDIAEHKPRYNKCWQRSEHQRKAAAVIRGDLP